MEYDKTNFFKWLYFQIGVKEKKLKLPVYYKYILEESEANFIKNLSIFKEHKKLSKGNIRKRPIEKKSQRLSFFSDNFLTNENHFNTYKYLPKEETGREHYSVEEYKKITNFKQTKEILKNINQKKKY